MRVYRVYPVAVVHVHNGLEAAAWLDDASPFLRTAGPYPYNLLRYYVAGTPIGAGLGAGAKPRAGRPSGEEGPEEFDFPAGELELEEAEALETGSALASPKGVAKPAKPGLTLAPEKTPLPGLSGNPEGPGAAEPGPAAGQPALPQQPEPPGLTDVAPEVPGEPALAGVAEAPESFYAIRVRDENGRPLEGVVLSLQTEGASLEGRSGKGQQGLIRIDKAAAGVAEVRVKDLEEARRAVLDSLAEGPIQAGASGGGDGGGGNRLLLRAGAEPVLAPSGQETEIVLVAPPREATVIEVVDGMFRLDSAVVLPEAESPSADTHESLTSVGLFAAALEFAEANPNRKLLVAGHTDTSGTERHNQALSEDRAASVLFCLAGGGDSRIAFGDLCDRRHAVADRKQILSWAAARFGFPCHPGKIDDVEFTGIEPIKAFQRAYNAARADLGVPDAEELKVDGSMGPKTWRAVFDCYEAALADEVSDKGTLEERLAELEEMRGKLRFMDDGTRAMGFGESHPIDEAGRDGFRSLRNRRVEILFFHEGEEPDLDAPPGESEIYAPGIFTRIPIDGATPGTLNFLVTDDRGLPVPGATVEATGPGGVRTALTGAAGSGAFAGLPRGIYVVTSRKQDLWLDRVAVKVAPGSEARPLPARAQGGAA